MHGRGEFCPWILGRARLFPCSDAGDEEPLAAGEEDKEEREAVASVVYFLLGSKRTEWLLSSNEVDGPLRWDRDGPPS